MLYHSSLFAPATLERERRRSLPDIAVRDEANEEPADARPQATKNRRRIRWNTLRIFRGRERRRCRCIVRRSRKVNVGQAPRSAIPEGRMDSCDPGDTDQAATAQPTGAAW